MNDWLGPGKTESQKIKEERQAEKLYKRARRHLKREFYRWMRSKLGSLSAEIEPLLRDIGMHAWGRGLLFNRFQIKRGFEYYGFFREWPPRYYWLVRGWSGGVYRGYQIYLKINAEDIEKLYGKAPEDIQRLCRKVFTENDLCLSSGRYSGAPTLTLSDVTQESLRGFLKIVYSNGTNYYHDPNPTHDG
jgi:hypothetical protein